MKTKKLKSTWGNPIHAKAPGFNKYSFKTQFIGVVMVKTKMTAIPSPDAVFTFFEQAKNEHIPKKRDNKMLLILSNNV